jgi:hypothetical protein
MRSLAQVASLCWSDEGRYWTPGLLYLHAVPRLAGGALEDGEVVGRG